MNDKKKQTFRCQICNHLKKTNELMPAELVHLSIVESIVKELPVWSSSGFICLSDLNL